MDRQERLLATFQDAIRSGDTRELEALVTEDVEIRQDTGGKVAAAVHRLQGKLEVIAFLRDFLHRVWSGYRWSVTTLDGQRAILLEEAGRIVAAVSFGYDAHANARGVFITRNPDKLARLLRVA